MLPRSAYNLSCPSPGIGKLRPGPWSVLLIDINSASHDLPLLSSVREYRGATQSYNYPRNDTDKNTRHPPLR